MGKNSLKAFLKISFLYNKKKDIKYLTNTYVTSHIFFNYF